MKPTIPSAAIATRKTIWPRVGSGRMKKSATEKKNMNAKMICRWRRRSTGGWLK